MRNKINQYFSQRNVIMEAISDNIIAQLRHNLAEVQDKIASAAKKSGRDIKDITLVAVTKTVTADYIQALLDLGVQHIGENRIQSAQTKFQQIHSPATWHLIGHLQKNKIKQALKIFQWIHSIDSLELAETLNRYTTNTIPILLEVNVSGETSKQGFESNILQTQMESLFTMPHLCICGLMTMAPLTTNLDICRDCFSKLRKLAEELNQKYQGSLHLQHLSMGMSQDYEVAIEEGATMVRVGSALVKNISF